uniref:Uncharacterized protein n=1 Tax=Phytophthora ramorum TaxID=164328 RepID=H3GIP2_PHYRM
MGIVCYLLQRHVVLCIAAIALCNSRLDVTASIAPRSYFSTVHTPQSPSDPVISDAANFALDQLRALSDSGIYTTLSLAKIHAAATEVALASPYFRSKREVEDFEMMVLESKPRVEERAKGGFNATRSIAIDEFPEMDEDAIERFWVQMVEERRQRRHELFEKWEREEVGEDEGENAQPIEAVESDQLESMEKSTQAAVEKVTKTLTIDELQVMPAKQLRQLLATPESTAPLRAAISAILDERLTLLEEREEALHAQDNLQQSPQLTLHRDEL